MKRSTVTLAAGLILTAAALKLAFPDKEAEEGWTASVGVPTMYSSDREADSTAPAMPVVVTINAGELLGKEEPDKEEKEPLPPAVEEAVETFLTEQEPFEDLAVPADVTYEVVLPDFAYVKPVSAPYSSGFGYRVHPLENLTKFHYGADLAAQSGEDIHCFAEGTVTEVGQNETFGKYIRVSHPDGFASLYAHCGTIYAAKGQAVAMGEKIALVGATGKATGPHLHFELTKDGVYVNPAFYLAAL